MKKRFGEEEQKMRDNAAESIREHRHRDRMREHSLADDFMRNRGALEYTDELRGLTHFFSYARSLSFGKVKVLDIGAGTTRADADFRSLEELTYNIDLKATSLTADPTVDRFLGKKNLSITSAEILKRIKDNEIAGIIAVNSIGHSKAPELVAKSLDRVLMPGGVVKASYADGLDDDRDPKSLLRLQLHQRLVDALKESKFDVALREYIHEDPDPGMRLKCTVLTAIKPPVVGISASRLLDMDWKDMPNQMQSLSKKGIRPVGEELVDKHLKKDILRAFDKLLE